MRWHRLVTAQRNTISQAEIERIREEERRTELKVIKKQKNKRAELRRNRLAMMLMVTVVLTLCFSYILIESRIYNLGYEINSLKTQVSQVQKDNERLGLEVEALYSSERIATYAKENLNMVYPDQRNISYIEYTAADTGQLQVANAKTELPAVPESNDFFSPVLNALERLVSDFFASVPAVAKQ